MKPFRTLNGSRALRFCALVVNLLLSASLLAPPALAQTAPQPEREQLLNGLRLLLWLKPGNPDVILKLRINSGAAFDLSGKSGQMALLGDMLFPDPATIDYFTDEMGGKLDVEVTYDSVTVTMIGKAVELEQIVEVLRNALLATQFAPELVTRMRETRIKSLRDSAVAPASVADRAIAARLFGDFPYGRPAAGSPEDLARVDRADLMLAHERFLNSNNATLAIVGHEPLLSHAASWFLSGLRTSLLEFKPGAACLLHFPDEIGVGRARLVFALTPRQLRRMR